MEQVTIHLTGSAEEVRAALLVLSGVPNPRQLPISAAALSPIGSKVESKESKVVQTLHRGPYSATLCAREGCPNKLTVKQVRQGSKYCSMSCAGMARRGVVRAKATPPEVSSRAPAAAEGATIVAGEGVTKGSAMSAESASKLPVPS